MAGILGLLSFALFIALIVGLVKPSLVLRWTNKPTRLKVIGYWFLSIIITGILGVMFIDDTINPKANIESANKYIEDGNYSNAISELEKIQKTDTLYNNAQFCPIKYIPKFNFNLCFTFVTPLNLDINKIL